MSLFNIFSLSSSALTINDIVIIILLMSLPINSSIVSILDQFRLIDFSIICYISLDFWMHGSFLQDVRHYEFYFVVCWIFPYSYKQSQSLFWDTVTPFGSSLILSVSALQVGPVISKSVVDFYPLMFFQYLIGSTMKYEVFYTGCWEQALLPTLCE